MKTNLKSYFRKFTTIRRKIYADIFDIDTNFLIKRKVLLQDILQDDYGLSYFLDLDSKRIQLEFYKKNGETTTGKQNYRRETIPAIQLNLHELRQEPQQTIHTIQTNNNYAGLKGEARLLANTELYENLKVQHSALQKEIAQYKQKLGKTKKKIGKLKEKILIANISEANKPMIKPEYINGALEKVPDLIMALRGFSNPNANTGLNAPNTTGENLTQTQSEFINIVKTLDDITIQKLYHLKTLLENKPDFNDKLTKLIKTYENDTN